jgi:SNF2 family DNA or RNA helicase
MIQVNYLAKLDSFAVQAPFQFKDKLKEIPSRQWSPLMRAWIYPATSGAAGALARVIGPPGDGLVCAPEFVRAYEQHAKRQALLAGNHNGFQHGPTATKSFEHQKLAVEIIAASDCAYLAWEMGTGKTKATIDSIIALDARLTFVGCPKSVVRNWPGQWAIHGDPRWHVEALDEGSIAERARRARLLIKTGQRLVLVMNYEAAWREPMAQLLMETDWDMIVADEIHRIKDPKGKQSGFFGKLAQRARRRVGLSGTPMPNGPLDLWAQMRFLDKGVFGESFFPYKMRYTVLGGYQNKAVVNFRHLDELNERFYSIAHRVTKEEVLDLPEETATTVEIALSCEAAEVYTAIENDFCAAVRAGTVSVDNALTEILRLQQITGGFVKNDEGRIEEFANAKQFALEEIFDDLDPEEPVVVFCKFHHDLDAIRAAAANCKRKSVELSGRMNEIGWKWEAGPATVAAVQIQAGGLGVDFTRARYAIYFSLNHSNGDYEQSKARLHRQGQRFNVTYIHLIAKGTIDEKIYSALQHKEKVIQAVLKDFERV